MNEPIVNPAVHDGKVNFCPLPDASEAALIVSMQCPVFPCDPSDKTPYTTHGFKDATKNGNQILDWWTKHPDALVGVPTGAASGIVVIDDDTAKKPDPASTAWLEANRALLETTRRHATRSGGTHYVFAAPGGVVIKSRKGITVGGLKLASIDTRGNGGYIIHWPSHGLASVGDIQPLPQALIDQLCEPKAPPAPSATVPPVPVAAPNWVWNAKAIELRAALAHLDPADRDTWYKTGMAIHHENPGAEGFNVWHGWSAGELTGGDEPANYEGEGDCRATWESFGKNTSATPLTINSVFAWARERGYAAVPPAPPVPTGTQTPPGPVSSPYRIQSLDDVLNVPDMEWMVDDVLPMSGLASVYGQWGTGKSFFVIDLAGAVASGTPWFGRDVKQCPVLYIVLEGAGGIKKRMQAYNMKHGRPSQLHFILNESFNLLTGSPDIARMQATLRAMGWKGGLLIVDTLSAAIPGGKENAPEVMSGVVESLKVLQREFGGLMLLVHHMGKNPEAGMRGSSALPAALDATLEISRDEKDSKQHWWSTSKVKDGPDDVLVGFKLPVVTVGNDKRGKAVTSCVVAPDAVVAAGVIQLPSPLAVRKQLQRRQARAFKEVQAQINKAGMKTGDGKPCVSLLLAQMEVAKVLDYASKGGKERGAKQALKSLIDLKYLAYANDVVWVVFNGEEAPE